jgi:hypothetical protein
VDIVQKSDLPFAVQPFAHRQNGGRYRLLALNWQRSRRGTRNRRIGGGVGDRFGGLGPWLEFARYFVEGNNIYVENPFFKFAACNPVLVAPTK